MTTTIGTTTVRCLRCGSTHTGVLEQEDGNVYGRVDCPHASRRVWLSGDAELFTAMRAKSCCVDSGQARRRPPLIALLPITNHCNFRCPICYANAGPELQPAFLSLAEAERRALQAKSSGARTISLTGGEPTLHPQLPELIRLIRRLGLHVYLVSNGLRLGTETALAATLRRAGLSKVKLQLDSFVPEIHRRLRGNAWIQEKKAAARNIVAAGLRLGTITTVTKMNLPEIGDIIRFGLSMAPQLNVMVFQAAAPAGRFELDRGQLVDKEVILRQVLASGALPDATLDDVWPLPRVEPWGMRVHPDCGVNLLMLWSRGKLQPAREFMDLPALHQKLDGLGGRTDWWTRNLSPLKRILGSTRPGRRVRMVRGLAGFLFGGRQHSMVVVGVGAFCRHDFFDMRRLAGCATVELTAGGPVSPCECHAHPQS
jgi:organic radical activating enzyme